MEQANTIELHDEDVFPDETVLRGILGKSYVAYIRLLNVFDEHEMAYDWKYYKDGKAWLCKVQKKTRTIVWMSAWKGYIKATIYIQDKHMDGLFETDISEETRKAIMEAKNVGKSKPCMFEIRDMKSLKDFSTVMEYKIEKK